MSVHVLERKTLRQHQHLQVVQQLRDLFSCSLVRLVLGRHPHLSGLFDEYGEAWGIEDALDYGLDGIIEQSLGNALRIGQDAATGGASTITVG